MQFARLFLLALCVLTILPKSLVALPETPLSDRHKEWLERDVVYIISDRERRVFMNLPDEVLRDQFIEMFWSQRDPTPATQVNEFKDEHYRRLAYVNLWFGSRAKGDGWRSDRGRIYMLFGEPQQKTKFTGENDIRDCEIWFYDAQGKIRGVPFFRLIFFQRTFAHDFVLYSPTRDGPQELVMQIAPTREQALRFLYDRAGDELWAAAQTSIPTEPPDGTWSPGTEILLSKIENLKNTLTDSTWAESFVATRGRVSARLSFRNLNAKVLTRTIFNMNKQAFLHTGLEIRPEDLQVGDYDDDRFYTSFDVRVFVEDQETGREVLSRADHWETRFETRDGQPLAKPIAFEQVFPLVPGRYRAFWIFDDLITETFSFREQHIEIPGPDTSEAWLTPPLLTRRYETLGRNDAVQIVPFRIFNLQYFPDYSGNYNAGDNLSVFFQYFFPVAQGKAPAHDVTFEIELLKRWDADAKKVQIEHVVPADRLSPEGILFVHRQIPVTELPPGEYDLTVRARSEAWGERVSEKVPLSFKGEEILVRPKPDVFLAEPKQISTAYLLERSRQFEVMGRIEEAIAELRLALEKNPKNAELQARLDELNTRRNTALTPGGP